MTHTVTEVLTERAAELTELFVEARELRQIGARSRAIEIEREALSYRNHTVELIENWAELGLLPDGVPRKFSVLFGVQRPILTH